MSRISYVLVILACLNGWCAASFQLKVDMPKLPNITPLTALPPGIPTCVGTNSDLNACIKNGLKEIKPRLKSGIPELSIPPLDPLVLGSHKVEMTDDFAKGYLNVHNLIIKGISESTVDTLNLEMQGDHVKLQVTTKTPSIEKQGAFQGELTAEGLNLKPEGQFTSKLTDLQLDIEAEGDLTEREGHKYLQLKSFNVIPQIGDLEFNADNIVPDKGLNTVILAVINSHWPTFYKLLVKETRTTWEPIVLFVANAYLTAVPFDLFIDAP
ncbi:circadian clock-controlled protein daywake [Bactrocera dorsalis]|uniref:Circadian clock-controlled protein daywake n=1 Tax=Bactrocera dorsalis TaxID=27457 RepID=A0A6I9W635_BACDO|nr:circadian clock-controlled protein daywake [Bactrocera dorsalis]